MPPSNPSLFPQQNVNQLPTGPFPDRGMERANFPLPQSTPPRKYQKNPADRLEDRKDAEMFSQPKPKAIDFSLPELDDDKIVDPEKRFQQMMKDRQAEDTLLQQNAPTKEELKETQRQLVNPKPLTSNVNMVPQRLPSASHPASEFAQSFTHGLNESLLNTNVVKDTPGTKYKPQDAGQSQPISSFRQPQQHLQLPPPPESIQYIAPPPKPPQMKVIDRYLTINSKFRDVTTHPNSLEFSLPVGAITKESVDYKDDNGVILFKEPGEEREVLSADDLRNVMAVECLDVIVPKCLSDVFEEPYLWLCVDEWGTNNKGTDVPEGAFARLKPINGHPQSSFITLRAHLLERQMLEMEEFENLTFKICNPYGEPCEIDDVTYVDKIEQKGFSTFLTIDINSPVEIGDRIYIKSLFNQQLIEMYPSVYLHSVKLEKNTLSFKSYVYDDKENSSKSKIGKYTSSKDKTPLNMNDFLAPNDYVFLEFENGGKRLNGWFLVKSIESGRTGATVKIDFPHKKPKTITRIGFSKKCTEGHVSNDRENLLYKGGLYISGREKNVIEVKCSDSVQYPPNSLFFLQAKRQVNMMFRLTCQV
jgi:hypothetical protein